MYVNSHFVVTTTFLIWLYLARNHAYYFVRNMFMVAMGLALVGYTVFPTAPPRFLPEWGFTDTVANFVGEAAENSANVLYNPFAAVPSMHVAFALMIAVPAFMLVRNRVLKALWAVYPLVVTFVVMVTANHYLARRGARRPRRGRVRVRRQRRLRSRPAGSLGVAHGRRQGAGVSDPVRERARGGNGKPGPLTATEIRALARDRLIESRLTPNAISLTGLLGNVVAAVLIVENHFVLAGIAFILGSVCDMLDGRYSRMSGKGIPLRRLPRLDARPRLRGRRAGGGRRLLRPAAGRPRRRRHRPHGRGLVLGQLHACPRRGARGRVQGRDRLTAGARSDPLDRTRVRGRGAAARLGPARASIYVMAALTIFTTFQRVFHVRTQLRQLADGADAV